MQKKGCRAPLRGGKDYDIIFSVFDSKASLTQLVECHLAKVVVEGSSPLARSILNSEMGA